jgi:hypothetical protein
MIHNRLPYSRLRSAVPGVISLWQAATRLRKKSYVTDR